MFLPLVGVVQRAGRPETPRGKCHASIPCREARSRHRPVNDRQGQHEHISPVTASRDRPRASSTRAEPRLQPPSPRYRPAARESPRRSTRNARMGSPGRQALGEVDRGQVRHFRPLVQTSRRGCRGRWAPAPTAPCRRLRRGGGGVPGRAQMRRDSCAAITPAVRRRATLIDRSPARGGRPGQQGSMRPEPIMMPTAQKPWAAGSSPSPCVPFPDDRHRRSSRSRGTR